LLCGYAITPVAECKIKIAKVKKKKQNKKGKRNKVILPYLEHSCQEKIEFRKNILWRLLLVG
jgi:hypothetical protein